MERVRDQSGITLVELLVTITLSLLLLGSSLNLLASSSGSHDRTQARANTVDQVQVGVARLMHELHQAEALNFFSSQVVDAELWTTGGSTPTLRRVRYDCSTGRECRRYEAPSGAALPANYAVLVTEVVNPDVFTPEPDFLNPTYIGVRVRLSVQDAEQPVTVSDGTSMLNRR